MKVLFFQQRSWGVKFGHYLATMIAADYPGSRFAAVVFKEPTLRFTRSQREIEYDTLRFYDDVQNRPRTYIRPGLTLRDVCAGLGIPSVWPLMQSMRDHVKDYSRKYYYSFRSQARTDEMRDLILATYSVVSELFEEFRPDVVVMPNFVGLPHLMASLYARHQGVRTLAVTDSKVRGVNMWIRDHFESEGAFFDCYREYASGATEIPPEIRSRAEAYLQEFRTAYIIPDYTEKALSRERIRIDWSDPVRSLRKAARSRPVLVALWRTMRGTSSAIEGRVTLDNRSRSLIWRDYRAEREYARRLLAWDFDSVGDGEEFAFFPLQYQPEASVDVLAPHFNNQIEVVRQAAMSLPGDLTLVVKEHPGMIGKRPPSYLEKIQRLPNVKFVDVRTTSYDLIRRSRAVISINSTACIEAAFLGVPTVQFGSLGTTLLLPHVVQCTDFTKLAEVLEKVLLRDVKGPEYERCLIAYIAAAYRTGIETNYSGMWEYGHTGDISPLWTTLKRELEMLLVAPAETFTDDHRRLSPKIVTSDGAR